MALQPLPTRDAVLEERGGLISRPWLAWLTKELVPAVDDAALDDDLEALDAAVASLAATVAAADAALDARTTAIEGRLDDLDAPWSDVSFDPAHYVADLGAWTLTVDDVQHFKWKRVGPVAHLSLRIQTSTVAVNSNSLQVALPDGIGLPTARFSGSFPYLNAGTAGTGFWQVTEGGSTLFLFRDLLATDWVGGGANDTYVHVTIAFETAG